MILCCYSAHVLWGGFPPEADSLSAITYSVTVTRSWGRSHMTHDVTVCKLINVNTVVF